MTMASVRPAWNCRGFGLAELMVALAVVGLVLGAAIMSLEAGLRTVQTSAGRAETQGSARVAIQRLVPEIREAGYNSTGLQEAGTTRPFDAIRDRSATGLTIWSDRNSDGVIQPTAGAACTADPAATATASEIVRYRLSGGQLLRSVNPTEPACEVAVATGLSTLAFSYLDAAGTVTQNVQDIRSVVISLDVVSEALGANPHQPTAAHVSDRVRLRNR
jgi:type IV pilus assembly protein PilW